MLETYKKFAKAVWSGLRVVLLAMAVLLPSIAVLVYMFATWTPDIGIVPGIIVFAVNVLWAPVPLRPFCSKDYSLGECYVSLLFGAFAGVCFTVCLFVFIVGCLLPIIGGLAICSLTSYSPTAFEMLVVILLNVVWAPGAYYGLDKLVTKVLNKF